MDTKIDEKLIREACTKSLFKYLSEHHESILISGERVKVLDASLNPQRDETYLNVTPKFELSDVIKDLEEFKESNITLNVTCSLYAVNSLCNEKLQVKAVDIAGKLVLQTTETLELIMSEISFQPRYPTH